MRAGGSPESGGAGAGKHCGYPESILWGLERAGGDEDARAHARGGRRRLRQRLPVPHHHRRPAHPKGGVCRLPGDLNRGGRGHRPRTALDAKAGNNLAAREDLVVDVFARHLCRGASAHQLWMANGLVGRPSGLGWQGVLRLSPNMGIIATPDDTLKA